MRILITVSPRLYREVLALSILRHRPDFEVLLAPSWRVEDRAEPPLPHVLVQDAADAGPTGGVLCRVRILVAERVDATVEMNGATSWVPDASLEDLFEVLDTAQLRAARAL